ncbi:hypothetical protein Hanom_Chr09g00764091 [Helianthus anomalus]
MKFFYIREEVIPVDMDFRDSAAIPKEDMKIPVEMMSFKNFAYFGIWAKA